MCIQNWKEEYGKLTTDQKRALQDEAGVQQTTKADLSGEFFSYLGDIYSSDLNFQMNTPLNVFYFVPICQFSAEFFSYLGAYL